jgi:alcohol dehydrogenase class IV
VNFEFATATRVIFGPGSLEKLAPLAADYGKRALLVCGVARCQAERLLALLDSAGVQHDLFPISGEPQVGRILEGLAFAREEGCDWVLGFGGGSAIDAGKALAALLANPGDMYDYLEVVGRGKALENPSLPFVAIPTTAGTGSEVTRNAVLGVPEQGVKVSLRSPQMLPRLALVDPELTYSLPPAITASTGLDALTQVIEPFVCSQPNPLVDALCREAIPRAARALPRACAAGDDAEARQEMSLVSLFGGLALANAKLGAVHGFAAPLGGLLSAPHGAVCARLLPLVMQANLNALQQRQPENPVLRRFDEIARLLTGDPQAVAQNGCAWLQEFVAGLGIPPLSAYGLERAAFPALVEKAARASSMAGNPIRLTPEELEAILERGLE